MKSTKIDPPKPAARKTSKENDLKVLLLNMPL